MIKAVDAVKAAFPAAVPSVIVDDPCLMRFGGEKRVHEELVGARQLAIKQLAALGLQIAGGKSNVMANRRELRAKVCKDLRRDGFEALALERNLGIDFSAGRRIHKAVRKKRLLELKQKTKRVRCLRGKAAQRRRKRIGNIMQAGPLAGGFYGVGTTGVSEGDLCNLRRAAGAAIESGTLRGKSLSLVLATSGKKTFDPIFRATVVSIQTLATVLGRLGKQRRFA